MLSKRDNAYVQLRSDILDGSLMPGDAISERSVAESIGASRVPLREALIQLQRDGLVTVAPHRGAFVRAFTLDTLQQLYELRGALEGLAASKAAVILGKHAMTPHIKAFKSTLRLKTPDAARPEREGVDFHEAIINGCGNPMVTEACARIRGQSQLAKRMTYYPPDHAWLRRSTQEHLDIAEAISRGDSLEAERQMRAHISAWSRRFRHIVH